MMDSIIDSTNSRKTVLLVGSCEYELIGFESLLVECDFIVEKAKDLDNNLRQRFDMVVIALSSEPLLKWGRFISVIANYHQAPPAKLIIFTPEKLCNLKLLTPIALVFNGRRKIPDLKSLITSISKNNPCPPIKVKGLSAIQRRELVRLKLIASGYVKQRTTQTKLTYYHRFRIANLLGVDNLHVLFVVGLLLEDISILQFN
ncbi:hypothetical protein G9G39_21465 [Cronobacter sp. EKM101R]|uniref:hypothetical protein n=1 Tax=unclassified Cronobacter TaxID=2649764 RepID=UPI0013EBCA6E|nr:MULTISPECIES: hypothetical protein [unclassified Cronobacter]KAF6590702.1 hypothetical protein G9G39_21465 [Cronobacter sp. EKM101R]KAF6593155.1 hypothetical protein G9G38_21215 [Cronobacter sp. EKM102R]